MYNFRVGGREPGLGPLWGHLKTGGRGVTRHNQPQPSELFSGWPSPQGPSCWPGATHQVSMKPRVPMERSQPCPSPLVAHRPFPNYSYQLKSSCGKLPPFPTSHWGPVALDSRPYSVMVAPLCLSVPIWTPRVGSLSCQVLSPEQGPSPQEVHPGPPGYLCEGPSACIPHSVPGRSWEPPPKTP